jgi:hypothetical protein
MEPSTVSGAAAIERVLSSFPQMGPGIGNLGETEIENLHQARIGNHDVAGLQVAVHDAGVVSHVQRVGHLHGVLQGQTADEARPWESAPSEFCRRRIP